MTHSTAMQIRVARPADANAIAALHAESWRRHYRGAYSDSFLDGDVDADRLEVWTKRLGHSDGTASTILAEVEGAVVGFAHVVFDDDSNWGSLVDNLHVAFDRKRHGIGSRLMTEMAREVVARGSGGLYLWVLEQNTIAQTFYEALDGHCVERAFVAAPGGDLDRLNGMPAKLRYVWADPAALLKSR